MKNKHPSQQTLTDIPELELLTYAAVSAVLRKENALRSFLRTAVQQKINAKKLYETLLQTYLFAGFPSALISISILSEYFILNKNNHIIKDYSKLKESGEKTCKKIYGDKYDKLINNVSGFSAELSEWLVVEGYGKVLSRRGLRLKERELINVAVLSTLKFESQLYSHINGAYRNKASVAEIRNIIECLEIFDKKITIFGLSILQKFLDKKKLPQK